MIQVIKAIFISNLVLESFLVSLNCSTIIPRLNPGNKTKNRTSSRILSSGSWYLISRSQQLGKSRATPSAGSQEICRLQRLIPPDLNLKCQENVKISNEFIYCKHLGKSGHYESELSARERKIQFYLIFGRFLDMGTEFFKFTGSHHFAGLQSSKHLVLEQMVVLFEKQLIQVSLLVKVVVFCEIDVTSFYDHQRGRIPFFIRTDGSKIPDLSDSRACNLFISQVLRESLRVNFQWIPNRQITETLGVSSRFILLSKSNTSRRLGRFDFVTKNASKNQILQLKPTRGVGIIISRLDVKFILKKSNFLFARPARKNCVFMVPYNFDPDARNNLLYFTESERLKIRIIKILFENQIKKFYSRKTGVFRVFTGLAGTVSQTARNARFGSIRKIVVVRARRIFCLGLRSGFRRVTLQHLGSRGFSNSSLNSFFLPFSTKLAKSGHSGAPQSPFLATLIFKNITIDFLFERFSLKIAHVQKSATFPTSSSRAKLKCFGFCRLGITSHLVLRLSNPTTRHENQWIVRVRFIHFRRVVKVSSGIFGISHQVGRQIIIRAPSGGQDVFFRGGSISQITSIDHRGARQQTYNGWKIIENRVLRKMIVISTKNFNQKIYVNKKLFQAVHEVQSRRKCFSNEILPRPNSSPGISHFAKPPASRKALTTCKANWLVVECFRKFEISNSMSSPSESRGFAQYFLTLSPVSRGINMAKNRSACAISGSVLKIPVKFLLQTNMLKSFEKKPYTPLTEILVKAHHMAVARDIYDLSKQAKAHNWYRGPDNTLDNLYTSCTPVSSSVVSLGNISENHTILTHANLDHAGKIFMRSEINLLVKMTRLTSAHRLNPSSVLKIEQKVFLNNYIIIQQEVSVKAAKKINEVERVSRLFCNFRNRKICKKSNFRKRKSYKLSGKPERLALKALFCNFRTRKFNIIRRSKKTCNSEREKNKKNISRTRMRVNRFISYISLKNLSAAPRNSTAVLAANNISRRRSREEETKSIARLTINREMVLDFFPSGRHENVGLKIEIYFRTRVKFLPEGQKFQGESGSKGSKKPQFLKINSPRFRLDEKLQHQSGGNVSHDRGWDCEGGARRDQCFHQRPRPRLVDQKYRGNAEIPSKINHLKDFSKKNKKKNFSGKSQKILLKNYTHRDLTPRRPVVPSDKNLEAMHDSAQTFQNAMLKIICQLQFSEKEGKNKKLLLFSNTENFTYARTANSPANSTVSRLGATRVELSVRIVRQKKAKLKRAVNIKRVAGRGTSRISTKKQFKASHTKSRRLRLSARVAIHDATGTSAIDITAVPVQANQVLREKKSCKISSKKIVQQTVPKFSPENLTRNLKLKFENIREKILSQPRAKISLKYNQANRWREKMKPSTWQTRIASRKSRESVGLVAIVKNQTPVKRSFKNDLAKNIFKKHKRNIFKTNSGKTFVIKNSKVQTKKVTYRYSTPRVLYIPQFSSRKRPDMLYFGYPGPSRSADIRPVASTTFPRRGSWRFGVSLEKKKLVKYSILSTHEFSRNYLKKFFKKCYFPKVIFSGASKIHEYEKFRRVKTFQNKTKTKSFAKKLFKPVSVKKEIKINNLQAQLKESFKVRLDRAHSFTQVFFCHGGQAWSILNRVNPNFAKGQELQLPIFVQLQPLLANHTRHPERKYECQGVKINDNTGQKNPDSVGVKNDSDHKTRQITLQILPSMIFEENSQKSRFFKQPLNPDSVRVKNFQKINLGYLRVISLSSWVGGEFSDCSGQSQVANEGKFANGQSTLTPQRPRAPLIGRTRNPAQPDPTRTQHQPTHTTTKTEPKFRKKLKNLTPATPESPKMEYNEELSMDELISHARQFSMGMISPKVLLANLRQDDKIEADGYQAVLLNKAISYNEILETATVGLQSTQDFKLLKKIENFIGTSLAGQKDERMRLRGKLFFRPKILFHLVFSSTTGRWLIMAKHKDAKKHVIDKSTYCADYVGDENKKCIDEAVEQVEESLDRERVINNSPDGLVINVSNEERISDNFGGLPVLESLQVSTPRNKSILKSPIKKPDRQITIKKRSRAPTGTSDTRSSRSSRSRSRTQSRSRAPKPQKKRRRTRSRSRTRSQSRPRSRPSRKNRGRQSRSRRSRSHSRVRRARSRSSSRYSHDQKQKNKEYRRKQAEGSRLSQFRDSRKLAPMKKVSWTSTSSSRESSGSPRNFKRH